MFCLCYPLIFNPFQAISISWHLLYHQNSSLYYSCIYITLSNPFWIHCSSDLKNENVRILLSKTMILHCFNCPLESRSNPLACTSSSWLALAHTFLYNLTLCHSLPMSPSSAITSSSVSKASTASVRTLEEAVFISYNTGTQHHIYSGWIHGSWVPDVLSQEEHSLS